MNNRNIVSTVNLDCKLDLKAIALQARNAEYNPKVCCAHNLHCDFFGFSAYTLILSANEFTIYCIF